MMKTLITTAIIVLSCQPLVAETGWISFGMGIGSEGLAGSVTSSTRIGSHGLVSLRGVITQELDNVNGDGWFSGESFFPGANDLGLLVGWVKTDDYRTNAVSVSVGIGVATITRKGAWDEGGWFESSHWDKKETTTAGLLFHSQVYFNKFGFQAFADLNSEASFGGFVISWRPFLFGAGR